MPSALFAWELGRGLGHVLRIKRLAARLKPHGIRPVAAVRNPASAQILTEDGIEVLQAPLWPDPIAAGSAFYDSSSTFGDMLAGLGLADARTLTAMLAAWDRLLALVDPDLIVADYAPAAMLAARGRFPLAVVGNGFTVPPAEMPSFPLLHNVSPPLRQEDEILHAVNAVLCARKQSPLDHLPQMLAGEVTSVQTFPLLDPYTTQRVVPVDGPIMTIPQPRRPDAKTIFVYVADNKPLRPDIVAALLPLGARLRVFAPGLSAGQIGALAKAGAAIEDHPLRLEHELATMGLSIHIGGLGVACSALAAGVPQLVLSIDIEKDLYGLALERAGVGRLIKIHDPAATISTALIEDLASDGQLGSRAMAVGEDHRRLLRGFDPLTTFEGQCLKLLQ